MYRLVHLCELVGGSGDRQNHEAGARVVTESADAGAINANNYLPQELISLAQPCKRKQRRLLVRKQ